MFLCFPTLIIFYHLGGIILIEKACLLLELPFSWTCALFFSFWRFRDFWEMREQQLPVKTEAKKLLITSSFSMPVVTRSPVLFTRRGTISFAFLFWLTYLKKPLLFLTSLTKCSSSCALAFLITPLSFLQPLQKKPPWQPLHVSQSKDHCPPFCTKTPGSSERRGGRKGSSSVRRWLGSWAVNQLLQEGVCSSHTAFGTHQGLP